MVAQEMKPVYAIATHAVSALGVGADAHWHSIEQMQSAIRRYEDLSLNAEPFWGSMPDASCWQMIQAQTHHVHRLTAFERLTYYSARQAVDATDIDVSAPDTAFVLSTTKGNIELLQQQGSSNEQAYLYSSASAIATALGISSRPFVVSHACVSGVIALQYGLQLIRSGRYRNVIVTGCDRFSRFVLSGFRSFQAVADEPCRPFDARRKGINLGEAAATIILSSDPGEMPFARLLSGATSNDANHISGPSRTGDELAMAIGRALQLAGLNASAIDMISAHGTATVYNDEMEAKAFYTAGFRNTPVHSLKGYVGHTLGAAGVLESVVVLESIRRQQLIPSIGFEQSGVSQPVNITKEVAPAPIRYVLKTASGFGGCNASLIWGA